MAHEFEEILLKVGSYGKYQKLMVTLVLVPTSFFIAMSIKLVVFQTVVPGRYWCNPPGRESTNYTKEDWWNVTVPRLDNGDFEKCLQYHIETEDGKYISTNTEVTTVCSSSWEHDRMFHETMATSMQWLCDKEIYSTHVLSANIAGNAVGTLLLPIIADKFTGRKLMFFISVAIHLIFNLLALVVPFYSLFLVLRFFGGLCFQTNYEMPYIIGFELTSPDKRVAISFYSFVAWTMGLCSTALVAWLVPHWWYMIVITCVISLLFFSYWKYLPESPRWLLSKGKIAECTDILLKVANTNGKEDIDRKTIEKELTSLIAVQEGKINFKEILKYKRTFINALLVTCLSLTTVVTYGCTVLNVKILPDNYFLSFFVLSLSELPANILSYYSVHYLGRKFTGIITYPLSMFFCFIATFCLKSGVVLLAVVSMIKISLTQGIYLIYVISPEVFPTPVRSTGMGIVILAGMTSLMFSPYIIAASEGGAFQYWVMIGLSSVSFILSVLLPETIGLPLPQTFPEADAIGRERPYFKWIHHWNKHKYESATCHEEKKLEN